MTLLCTNYCKNPSFEVNVTDDWTLEPGAGGGTANLDASQYYVGAKSCRIRAGSATVYANCTTGVSVPNGGTVTIHARMRASADPSGYLGFIRIRDYTNSANVAAISGSAAASGAWEYLTCSWTNDTGLAATCKMLIYNNFNDSAADVWFDACQLELASSATAYTDGSLGGQCAWTGDAHNSTSTRTLATQAVAGAQTNTGVVSKLTAKSFAGAQTNTGAVAKLMMLQRTVLTGAMTWTGTLTKKTIKVLAGIIQWVGTLVGVGVKEVFVVAAVDSLTVHADQGSLTFKCPPDDLTMRGLED